MTNPQKIRNSQPTFLLEKEKDGKASEKEKKALLTPQQISFLNKLKNIKEKTLLEKVIDESKLFNKLCKDDNFFEHFWHKVLLPINNIPSDFDNNNENENDDMASKTRSFTRLYAQHLDDDKDVSEECNTDKKRTIYIELLRNASNSGIQKINPKNVAEKTLIPVSFVINFMANPASNLYFFDSANNVLWLKKYFIDSCKIMGIPASFIGAIVNEYHATSDCVYVWQEFFRTNCRILNQIFANHFEKKMGIISPTRTEKQAQKIIKDLFDINNEVVGGKKNGEKIVFF